MSVDIGSDEALTGVDSPGQPAVVGYDMTASLFQYLARAGSLGGVEGPLGQQSISRELRDLLSAAHHILAGGEVRIEVVREGHTGIVNDLNARWDQVESDVNTVNSRAGYLVVSSV